MQTKVRILGIVGSPRQKGNTNCLVDEVLRGAATAGAGVEKIQLDAKKIKLCVGCDQCRNTGECRFDDDMKELIALMKESDIWVLGTPVYWWGPTALMKKFIDRWYQDYEGLQACGTKKVILVIPYGDSDPTTAVHTIGMFRSALNWLGKEVSTVIEGSGLSARSDAENSVDLLTRCYTVGSEAAKELLAE